MLQIKSSASVKKRKMSHIDITYIDKEDTADDKDEEKKDENSAGISPTAMVDILGWFLYKFYKKQ